MKLILGIESSCDETACAVVSEGKEILSNVVASQTKLHKSFGGVVPELACRRHVSVIINVIKQALEEANVEIHDIEGIAVAKGPGLVGALLIGLNTAKSLSLSLEVPYVGVNHVEAHLYATVMTNSQTSLFPALGVVISGGHTALLDMESIGSYSLIGSTVDDAVGEAFDKVASILGLPYPGGPQIEELAKKGDPNAFSFKPGKVKGRPYDFSFSGLKTNVLYAAKGQSSNKNSPLIIKESEKKDVAASFQKVAFNDIIDKTLSAATPGNFKSIILGGGVCNSQKLRDMFAEASSEIPVLWPPKALSLDNAAMIAGLGFHLFKEKPTGDSLNLEASPRIPFTLSI